VTITVIVPLFNKRPFVERALRSVFGQTCGPHEIIVVDDGSTDGGAEIVQRFSDPRLRLIVQENRGPGGARNRGLSEASGTHVAFLDADDAWTPSYLENAVAQLGVYPEAAAATCGYRLFPGGRSTSELWQRREITNGITRVDSSWTARRCIYLLAFMSPCTTVATADVVRHYSGFFDRDRCVYGEDAFLWLKLLLNHPVVTCLAPLVDVHSEASELNVAHRRVRPIEPLLTSPIELFAVCPERLKKLLKDILVERALKTATVLGYWGKWRDGRALLHRFPSRGGNRIVRRVAAHVAASPLGAGVGIGHRFLQRWGMRMEARA
jgi:glycosyltransferase involved in cell wall biosynthesis